MFSFGQKKNAGFEFYIFKNGVELAFKSSLFSP